MITTALCRLGIRNRTSIFSLGAVLALAQTGVPQSVSNMSTMPPVIVMGFVGGLIRHDNLVHSEVQLAARLRKAYPMGVDVETFESYRGEKAREKILKLLDANHDGVLTRDEKQNARIILYGHSWGGAEAIALARRLEKDGIPVLLPFKWIASLRSTKMMRSSRRTWPKPQISTNRMAFSTAGPKSALPIQRARVSSGIFDSTTKRARISAPSIPGTTALS